MEAILLITLITVFYLVPLVSINLNVIMTYINHMRNDKEYNLGIGLLQSLVSFLPVGNFVFTYIVAPVEHKEVFLLSYLKGLNDAMECHSCGLITRRHKLDKFEPRKNGWGDYEYKNDSICPHCENKNYIYKNDKYKNKKLPFGKRINWISGILKYFTLGLNENQRKLRDLKKKQSELEFVDSQMERWHRLQEEKLKRMERKVEELKKEMNI